MKKLITGLTVIIMIFACSQSFAQKLTIKPYGFFKFDLAYDQARTNNGNYVFWTNYVAPNADKDSEMNITARQTRLGFIATADETDNVKAMARLEIDFYGSGTENKNIPMMRHAFLKVDYGNFWILADQTFNPNVVNVTTNEVVGDVDSKGAWGCASLKVSEKTSFNAGFGIDKTSSDIEGYPTRSKNLGIFGNLFTKIAPRTRLGLELSNWMTTYNVVSSSSFVEEDVSNLRFQSSFIFSL